MVPIGALPLPGSIQEGVRNCFREPEKVWLVELVERCVACLCETRMILAEVLIHTLFTMLALRACALAKESSRLALPPRA